MNHLLVFQTYTVAYASQQGLITIFCLSKFKTTWTLNATIFFEYQLLKYFLLVVVLNNKDDTLLKPFS